MNAAPTSSQDQKFRLMRQVLEDCQVDAEEVADGTKEIDLGFGTDDEIKWIVELARTDHACRGAALTLAAYKAIDPSQDVRAHKEEQEGGFAARTYDNNVTVQFLIDHDLPRSVETHWLTQTISYAPKLLESTPLNTRPKRAGDLLVLVANLVNRLGSRQDVEAVVTLILREFTEERNRQAVILTRPKGLSIGAVANLVERHILQKYTAGGPRLPQIAVYALYECIVEYMTRYKDHSLAPLERLKSADRKSGSVGDVVVVSGKSPVEAVEIKHGKAIAPIDVKEAIDKVRGASVTRYYLLSTENPYVDAAGADELVLLRDNFLKQNGCEIIINGVLATVRYYLRLLPDTDCFIFNYAALLESDPDVGYEHRTSWNSCCLDL